MEILQLQSKAFAEFGTILTLTETPTVPENQEFIMYDTARRIALANLCCAGVLICRQREGRVVQLEHHKYTSEILVALDADVTLVVAPSGDPLQDVKNIRAFSLEKCEAVALKPGTWHWIPFPKSTETARVLVVFGDSTKEHDLNLQMLPEVVVF